LGDLSQIPGCPFGILDPLVGRGMEINR